MTANLGSILRNVNSSTEYPSHHRYKNVFNIYRIDDDYKLDVFNEKSDIKKPYIKKELDAKMSFNIWESNLDTNDLTNGN